MVMNMSKLAKVFLHRFWQCLYFEPKTAAAAVCFKTGTFSVDPKY
jgi:hypothetical protein